MRVWSCKVAQPPPAGLSSFYEVLTVASIVEATGSALHAPAGEILHWGAGDPLGEAARQYRAGGAGGVRLNLSDLLQLNRASIAASFSAVGDVAAAVRRQH